MAMNIKKGDTVVRISGDGGKDRDLTTHQGKVIATLPKENKVVVEGMNMVTCHIKPRRQGEEGGIMKREAAIYACKVQVVCPKCGKRRPQGGGRQENPRLQEVRRRAVRKES